MEIYSGVREAKTVEADSRMRRVMEVRRWIVAGLLGWGLSFGPSLLSAQEGSYAFQIRGGGTLPVAAFRDDAQGWEEEAGTGTSLGMGFTFPLYRFVGGYLGFSQHRFACDEEVCPKGKAWISTGFDLALRVVVGDRRIRPWVQGGLHTHRIESRVSVEGHVQSLHSKGGGGYEVGGGVLVQVAERMSLSPGVRYGSGDAPFSVQPSMGLRYLVFDLGLVVGF
jgi:hypothetical protein